MDELYGIHSTSTSYPLQLPDNMVAPAADYHGFRPPVAATFPVFGSERFFCGSSVSDDASIVAEMQRGSGGSSSSEVSSAIRAKIASHPLYPKLLQAYVDCQKVGAPPEMMYLLDEIRQDSDFFKRFNIVASSLGADPELDEFMESYCDILMKYKADLSKHFDEATTFLNDIEAQFNSLCNGDTAGSSDEDASEEEVEVQDSSRAHEERELKDKLLRKYSGYISTLRHEFSKKKKKGKLPKEARQILLNWWNIHSKWPYPTEADKAALADTTGLDQKQINNWFINQRKRHWKPSENMQFSVVDNLYGAYFMNE